MTRTCDLLVRSQTLYPTELRARFFNNLERLLEKVEPLAYGTLEDFLTEKKYLLNVSHNT